MNEHDNPHEAVAPDHSGSRNADSSGDAGDTPRNGGESASAASESAISIEALQTDNDGLKDRLLRLMADMENLRRRTEREVADARTYGATNLARDMIGVLDNLHRGVSTLNDDLKNTSDPALKSFIEGVQLTEADFLSRLTRHGIKKFAPAGQKFDPNRHEALFELPDESVPSGTVVQVVEAGYTIGDRVLRPAKVGVSRGGPKG